MLGGFSNELFAIQRLVVVKKRQKLIDKKLLDAVSSGLAKECCWALQEGARVNVKNEHGNAPLHIASLKGYEDIAEILIQAEADVNIQDQYGNTPLHGAVCEGHKNMVCFLISHGANVNAQNADGDTPLHFAVLYSSQDIIKDLIDVKADLTIRNNCQETALMVADKNDCLSRVELLLKHISSDSLKSVKRNSKKRKVVIIEQEGGVCDEKVD